MLDLNYEFITKAIIDRALHIKEDNGFYKARVFLRDFYIPNQDINDKKLVMFLDDIRIAVSKDEDIVQIRAVIVETLYKHRYNLDEIRWFSILEKD